MYLLKKLEIWKLKPAVILTLKYLLILIKIPECTRLFTSISAIIVVAINKLQFVILWLDEFFSKNRFHLWSRLRKICLGFELEKKDWISKIMKFQGCFLQILAFIAFLCRDGGTRKAGGGNFALPLDFDRIRSKILYAVCPYRFSDLPLPLQCQSGH